MVPQHQRQFGWVDAELAVLERLEHLWVRVSDVGAVQKYFLFASFFYARQKVNLGFGSLDFICIELINGVMIYRHDYLFRDLFGLSSVLCLRLDPVDD